MTSNRRLPGETWEEFRARWSAYLRSRRQALINWDSSEPCPRVKMVRTEWITDEHGNRSRQAIGM